MDASESAGQSNPEKPEKSEPTPGCPCQTCAMVLAQRAFDSQVELLAAMSGTMVATLNARNMVLQPPKEDDEAGIAVYNAAMQDSIDTLTAARKAISRARVAMEAAIDQFKAKAAGDDT